MNSDRVTTILNELRTEESEIEVNLDSLRADIKDAEAQLAQIRKAMSSLKGKSCTASSRSRVTATKEEVVATIIQVLRESGSVSEKDLRRRVEENLQEKGKSKVGLAMRLKSCLKDEQFIRTGNMLVLSQPNELANATANRVG